MMKIIHPLVFSTLFFSSHSFATVGGPQNIEVLGLDQAEALRQAWKEGKYPSKMALGKAFGISRQAVYRYLQVSE